jgi:hypothetical protein
MVQELATTKKEKERKKEEEGEQEKERGKDRGTEGGMERGRERRKRESKDKHWVFGLCYRLKKNPFNRSLKANVSSSGLEEIHLDFSVCIM